MKVKQNSDTGEIESVESKVGWVSYNDRKPPWYGDWWVKNWDEWDQVLLRNSKSRIKIIFKAFYTSRDFTAGDKLSDVTASKVGIRDFKNLLSPIPGVRLVPWWKRRKRRPNPFNAKGELCTKKD